ncbi:MAG: DUF6273 domain-containing protein [Treponema sp.]|jgi:hypothetical protein|nr:DUF6273 domain-containing protein [Treponema sp.]
MKCPHCNSKWETDEKVSSSLTSCPFCGKSLVKEEAPKKYDNSKDALAAIMKQFGPDVLLGKLNAHFPDFASVSAGDKHLVYAVYELGAAKVLKSSLAASQADKEIAVKIAVRTLTEAHISQDSAETIVSEFAAALGWQVNKPVPQSGLPSSQPAVTSKPTALIKSPPSTSIPKNTPKIIMKKVINVTPKIGFTIPFSRYNWQVLDIQGGEALIITKDIIEKRPYNNTYTDVAWETCSLRIYLNGEFLLKFTAEQQGRIVEKQISNPDNLWYGTAGGKDTRDKIFLLSMEEADRYFGGGGDYLNKRRKDYSIGKFVADSDGYFLSNNHDGERLAKDGRGEAWWWLRSPGCNSNYAVRVSVYGSASVYGYRVNLYYGGVRPALWLNL